MRLRNIKGAREEIERSPYIIEDPQKNRGNWKEFLDGSPIHVEIGMGKGRFIMDMAALHPDIRYIGIEMYSSVILRATQKMARLEEEGRPLKNLVLLREDARLLPEIFAEGEISKIYLNFSDPWPKARHAKRRLTSHQFLERYEKFLKPDGTLEFKTDNQDLFTFSLEEAAEAGWEFLYQTRDLHADPEQMKDNVMTEYEEKFSSKGNPICKMIIRQNAAGSV